jgi:hypothetical protein
LFTYYNILYMLPTNSFISKLQIRLLVLETLMKYKKKIYKKFGLFVYDCQSKFGTHTSLDIFSNNKAIRIIEFESTNMHMDIIK